jgi:uncharacterized membrane protein YhhN
MDWDATIGCVALTGLGVVAALAAAHGGKRGAYTAAKAVASAGFVALAVIVGATGATWSAIALGGLVVAAAGDVVLTGHSKKSFIIGLSCFAVAYATYAVAFLLRGIDGSTLAVAAVLAAAVGAGAWRYLRAHLPGKLRTPVRVYLLVVSSMLATGVAAGITYRAVPLALGAALITGSDLSVARERFVTPGFANKLVGLPAYYVGQTLIALSLVG